MIFPGRPVAPAAGSPAVRRTASGRRTSRTAEPPRWRARPARRGGRVGCAPRGRPSLVPPTTPSRKRPCRRSSRRTASPDARRSRRAPDLLDSTGAHDCDPVGDRHRLLLVVGHVDHGQPQLLLETLDLVAHQDEVRVEVHRGSSRRRTRGWTLSDRASEGAAGPPDSWSGRRSPSPSSRTSWRSFTRAVTCCAAGPGRGARNPRCRPP